MFLSDGGGGLKFRHGKTQNPSCHRDDFQEVANFPSPHSAEMR